MPDNRDFQRPKTPPVVSGEVDDPTPVEGATQARSLHVELSRLRADLHGAINRDFEDHQAIRGELGGVLGHVTDLKVETAKQTVILGQLTEADRANQAARRTTRMAIIQAFLAILTGLVVGYLLHMWGGK